MPLECPVCRYPISRLRSIIRTVWSRWQCPACQSVLGISLKRRLLATVPWIGILLFYLLYLNLMSWGLWIALPIIVVSGLAIYMSLERIVVHERCGLRCRECGYDLQGQVEPHCPECGSPLNEDEIERMKRADFAARKPVTVGRFGKWAAVIVIALLAMLVAGQVVHLCFLRTSGTDPRRETRLILNSILQYGQANAGEAPIHALQHVGGDGLLLLAWESDTSPAEVPLPGCSLRTFGDLTDEERKQTVQDAADALPEGTIAHRLGDYVFTYHGIGLAAPDPNLWLVIRSFDPDNNAPPEPSGSIIVGRADGQAKIIPIADISTALTDQNMLRARFGLAPLPDPATVTHSAPAIAPP